MRKAFDISVGVLALLFLVIFWPYTGGWKTLARHKDVEYDPESVFFLSFVGFFLHFMAGWRLYEWYFEHAGWAWWAMGLSAAYAVVSGLRLFLHVFGTGVEDDEENWNACHR